MKRPTEPKAITQAFHKQVVPKQLNYDFRLSNSGR